MCRRCVSQVAFSRAWVVGERTGSLRYLIDAYKFQRARAAHRALARLLHESLPSLPATTMVVSIPTIAQHVRERGYDHAQLVARHFARQRQLRCAPVLARRTATQQRQATRQLRELQAETAFMTKQPVQAGPYLLIDDVITTGSTVRWAAQCLKAAGAETIWVAALAQQPLDDTPVI